MMQQHLDNGRIRGSFILLGLIVIISFPLALSATETEAPATSSESMMVAQQKNVDHSMHKHAVADDTMQHGNMQMSQKAKTVMFWENRESQLGSIKDHKHPGQSTPSMSKRMTPEQPTTFEQAVLQSQEEHARMHQDPTYVCPMHPQIISKEPGSSCPICGMDLVLKDIAVSTDDHPQVFLSAMVIQNMGVRIAKVQRKVLSKQIRTQGIVTPDDNRILFIHPRTGGWIETLYPITEGERVKRKDVLANFYSPWINQVQLDYISALEEYDLTAFDPDKKAEVSVKLDSLRNSLRLLKVMDMDITRIKNSRKVLNTIQLLAPQGGIITKIGVREGTYVEPEQSMFTIVDLSQVWVMMDIYEYQAPWIRKGHSVKITAPAIPGRQWEGMVDFIYPEVNSQTRTLRARIELANPDEALLLNMFVQVDLSASVSKQNVLTVPREAVIVTGEREVVVKSLGKGYFQPVEISTGNWGNNQAEILSGLNEGDEVVVSGQFLIDSESNLQASFLRMME